MQLGGKGQIKQVIVNLPDVNTCSHRQVFSAASNNTKKVILIEKGARFSGLIKS